MEIIEQHYSLIRPRVTNATLLSQKHGYPFALLPIFGGNQAKKIIQRVTALSLKIFADFQHVF